MSPVIEERLRKIAGLSLKPGPHSPNSTFCVMEAVAYVAGEPWSDRPACACPIISTFLRSWNDSLPTDADRDRLLKALIPRLVGTKNPSLEERRGLMAADWLIRKHAPAWLRLAGLVKQAESLEALPEITAMAQFPALRGPVQAARIDAAAAGDATGAAAGAAWAAAGDAAWAAAGAAARDAAGDIAWAAAGDAARAAAKKKCAPVVATLQQSALELVERMIEANLNFSGLHSREGGLGTLEPHFPDSYDGEEDYADEPDEVVCPRCLGSGIEVEGWDCEYCDGYGYFEI